MSAEPTASGHWRRRLAAMEGHELVTLREALEETLMRPEMLKVRELLIGAHDELVADLTRGTLQPLPIMAKRTGLIAGLAGLEELIADVRRHAAEAEKQMVIRAERLERREEVRA